jgi:hypothetical protein
MGARLFLSKLALDFTTQPRVDATAQTSVRRHHHHQLVGQSFVHRQFRLFKEGCSHKASHSILNDNQINKQTNKK